METHLSLQKIYRSALHEIFKFLTEAELLRVQQLSRFFRKEASHDFFYRFLLVNQKMTYSKGFKQTWQQVYKAKFAAKKNLKKESWNYGCLTIRRQFTKLISGIEIWNNFVLAWAQEQFALTLLDEEDLEEDDNVVVKKHGFSSAINLVHIQEQSWDQCVVTFLLADLSIEQWNLHQTGVNAFNFDQMKRIEPVMQPSRKTVWQVVQNTIAIVNCPILEGDLFNGEESTNLFLVSLADLSVRSVRFDKPER